MFADLSNSVDVVIHNAWKVDFKLSLDSYKDVHIGGVRRIIDWSTGSRRSPRIVFVSSVAAASQWATIHQDKAEIPSVPETFLYDYEAAADMGYGESKTISERILDIANKQSGVPVSILRVGQIAGSTAWPSQEWLPSTIKTSKSSLPVIDWIPVDKLATIIIEIIHSDTTANNAGNADIYNLVNPHPIAWESLLGTLQSHLGHQVDIVLLRDWINSLLKLDVLDSSELARHPALKLLEMFEEIENGKGSLAFDAEHGVRASKTMATLDTVNPAWMNIWLEQWKF